MDQSERYDINAKAGGNARSEVMQGSMLQALLEDRFKLKGHHVSREISVYNLIVAKSRSKPQPFQERSCTANDFLLNPFPPPLAPDSRLTRKGPNWRLDMEATSVDDFCGLLRLDFPIVNKAGITGLFDLHFGLCRRNSG